MENMNNVRLGIIGIGNMGSAHALNINKIKGMELTALCDIAPERLEWAKKIFDSKVALFDNAQDMYKSGLVDAVLIATPHYDHPPLAIEAFANKLHVLVEKPAGVYTLQVEEMNNAAKASDRVFGIMYNQRTNPVYSKLRKMILDGELGQIYRTNWIITNWYRSQAYYDSGTWRATWSGEGGGVLINQDPHQLDLWQWALGDLMPVRVRAFCGYGKMHNIEVEDDVTAYVEYENGATGVFITSTYETPGTNRLEISGEMGNIIIEDGKILFNRNVVSERKYNSEISKGFDRPECWKCEVPADGENTGHNGILQNFTNAILHGEKLLAPGCEGIRGLTISNAIHLSSWLDDWVNLPLDQQLFYNMLQDKIAKSTVKKKTASKVLTVAGTH